MKREILDEPIRQLVDDFLEKEESVLWEGTPSIDSLDGSFFFILFIAAFPGLFLLLWYLTMTENQLNSFYQIAGSVIIFFSILLSYNYSKQLKRIRTHYFITQKQILFQLKKEIHSIPFTEINNILIIDFDPIGDPDYEDDSIYLNKPDKDPLFGTIFLAVKNPKLIPFQTYDFRTREKRAQPTLELIKTKKAGELIHQGIKNANL